MKNNIKWSELYKVCNHNKYCQITKVFRKYTMKSNIKNFIQNYGKILLGIVIIFLALLIYTFRSNLIIVFYCSILLFFMFLMASFNSTYKISLEEDKLIANINFADTIISYDKLENIYLSKEKFKILFMPIYYYSLKVSYYISDDRVNILSFPTLMLNKKNVKELFESFEVQSYKKDDDEIENMDKKNQYKAIAIVAAILFIILVIVSIMVAIFNK